MYNIKVTEEMGRGLYASILILPGALVCECEILLLSQDDTVKVNDTTLKYYTFKYNENQDCFVLGHGELFNHSPEANIRFELSPLDGRMVMRFYATKIISVDEQLFIDYNADTMVKVDQYIDAGSLVG